VQGTGASLAKFCQNQSNGCGAIFDFFKDGSRPPSWICRAYFGTTHQEYLRSLSVKSLVGIHFVLCMIYKFEYFASLAGKCQFTPINWGLGRFDPLNGKQH